VLVARLRCSDPHCAAEVSAETGTLLELAALECDCGSHLRIVGFPEVGEKADVVVLRRPGRLAGLLGAA
jgi:hypothetical protein